MIIINMIESTDYFTPQCFAQKSPQPPPPPILTGKIGLRCKGPHRGVMATTTRKTPCEHLPNPENERMEPFKRDHFFFKPKKCHAM